MFSIILMMIAGIVAGYLLRMVRLLGHVGRLISWTIYLMLFVLGLSVGSDRDIIGNLREIGLSALLLAVAGIAGSVLLSYAVYRLFYAGRISGGEGK